MMGKPVRPPAATDAAVRLAAAAARVAGTGTVCDWLVAMTRSAERATGRPGEAKPSCEGVQT
jgi:hypothetical protein